MMDFEIQYTKWDYRERGRQSINTEGRVEVTEKEEKSTTSEVDMDKEIENLRKEKKEKSMMRRD